mmetsp:Transcript_17501/g.17714  ORF Transcript_17501/g.17714 Transcript_17501/m.17714 type:complete len:130 (+) Transcript_17501:784-1173(+)
MYLTLHVFSTAIVQDEELLRDFCQKIFVVAGPDKSDLGGRWGGNKEKACFSFFTELLMQPEEADCVEVMESLGFTRHKSLLIPDCSSDEKHYLFKFPDVATAVKSGKFKSGLHHWKLFGRNEGRVYGCE